MVPIPPVFAYLSNRFLRGRTMKVKTLWNVTLTEHLVQSVIYLLSPARDGCEWSKCGDPRLPDASGVLAPLTTEFLHKAADLGFWNIVHGSDLYCAQSCLA